MKLRNKVTTSKGVKYDLEKEVFTGDYWVDGKPIFAKIFHIKKGELPNDGSKTYNLNLTNAEFVVDNNLNIFDPPNSKRFWQNGYLQFEYYIDLQKQILTLSTTGGWGNQEAYITLYYTKSGGGN